MFRLQRLEIKPSGISECGFTNRITRNRSLCFKCLSSNPMLHVMENGSLQSGKGRISDQMEQRADLRLSSILTNRQSIEENHGRESIYDINNTLWQTQALYPILLQLSVMNPILLPSNPNLLSSPKREFRLLIKQGSLVLVAWRVSGKTWRQKEYQQGLQILSQEQEDRVQYLFINRPGESELAGVMKGKLIPLNVM